MSKLCRQHSGDQNLSFGERLLNLCRICKTGAALLLLLATFPLAAATTNSGWVRQVWQSDDGLPNNTVTHIAQTRDGYLWIANFSRLARFDGVEFADFPSRVVVPQRDERISVLLRSRTGGLWVAMDHGPVALLNSKVEKLYTSELPDLIPTALAEDGEGALWIAYRSGVVCRIREGVVTQFSEREGLGAGPTVSIASDLDGKLWICRSTGQVGVFRDGAFVTLVQTRKAIARIAAARDGGVWVCAGNELFRLKEGGQLQARGSFKKESNTTAPTCILEDGDGGVWIGTTDSGVIRYDGTTFENVGVSHPEVLSLAEDRDGNVWVGTGGGGLNKLQRRAISLEDRDTGLPFETIQSICEDGTGAVWAVTHNKQLIRKTKAGWETVSTRWDWPLGTPSCVTADRNGTVWIGTEGSTLLSWSDQKYHIWHDVQVKENPHARSLLAANNGDVWIGGVAPESLRRFRDNKFHHVQIPPAIGIIRAMTEDSSGDIWVGTSKRVLLRISGDRVIDETRLAPYPMSIRYLHATPDGSVWIAYAGSGLARIKNRRYHRVSVSQGLYDDSISQIATDDRGWIWLGADQGIFKIRQAEFEKVAAGELPRLESIHYGRSAGLPSLQANFGLTPGITRTRDGRIWMPMRSALAVVTPALIREDKAPPPVQLTRVTLDDKVIAAYGGTVGVHGIANLSHPEVTVELPPEHHRLQFYFTAPSFVAPENVRFQYRLEGYEDRWVEAGNRREVAYSRLPAGSYRFKIKACNSEGVWNEIGAALAFHVTPFLWQKWWFRILVFLAFTGILYGIVRYASVRRLRAKLQKLEYETALENSRIAGMAQIATSVLHNVGNVLNSVNISNSVIRDRLRSSKIPYLTKTAALLQEHQHDLANFITNDPKGKQLASYLADLAHHLGQERDELVREVTSLASNLEHMKDIVARQQNYARLSGVLEPVNVAELVEDAIQINAASMTKDQVEIVRDFQPTPTVTTDKHKVLQILINLVSNAKYALRNAENTSRRLVVRVHVNGESRVKIMVADNGIGIAPENLPRIFQHGFTTKKEGHGFGLHSSAVAANELGGSLTASSEGPGHGATFTLELPANRNNAANPAAGSGPAPTAHKGTGDTHAFAN